MIVDDLPQFTQFQVDEQTHIILDREACKSCDHHSCVHSCPANCYTLNEETNRVNVVYENCLECGTCQVICDKQAIDWSYPRGGYGVCYRLT
jgi:ferredoxin like protein